MIKSESIAQLAKSLSAAQGEMQGAKKDAQNPFFKSNYSDLQSVVESIRAPFAKHGLAFTQALDSTEDGSIVVETYLLHSSGEYIGGRISQKPTKNDPQATGSLISYLKRYGLQAIAGIPSVDDDANDAMPNKSQTQMKVVDQVKHAFPSAAVVNDAHVMSDYVVAFGKYKGQSLKDIGLQDLKGYVSFIEASAKKDNKPIQGQVAEFIRAVKNYELEDQGYDT